MSLSRPKVNHLSQIVTERLAEMPEVTFCEPFNTVRLEVVRAINQALKLEEIVDASVRRILFSYTRKIIEGSREWDVMYQKLYDEELARH